MTASPEGRGSHVQPAASSTEAPREQMGLLCEDDDEGRGPSSR